ncbi:MAG: lysophospholipid acyltransferase family protein [Myxococcota bacterium]
MLDIPRLERIRLSGRPLGQMLMAWTGLATNYELPPRVRIRFEGLERVPDEPVFFAMNHTDRYNYWPFQYRLYHTAGRFTATWVKAKYYEHPAVAKFMEWMNNIPTVSRGYIITRDVLNTLDRLPESEEYAFLRARVEAVARGDGEALDASPPASLTPLFRSAHEILGRRFDPAREDWAEAADAVFRYMMRRFVDLNGEAFAKGLDLLVFPEGTRSVRLGKGHTGLSQMALKLRHPIVPVGCNGSDRVYPGGSPWARGGEIVYRFGEPITWEDMAPFHIPEEFQPFSPEAETRWEEEFQGLVDMVMGRIEALLDPRHRPVEGEDTRKTRGSARFV